MGLSVTSMPLSQHTMLSSDIDQISLYDFTNNDTVRFFPEGRIELLFQLSGDFIHRTSLDDKWILRPRGFVGGLHLQAYHVRSLAKSSQCLGISFVPGAAARYLPMELHKLNNAVSATDKVWGSEGAELSKSVLSCSDLHQQLDIILGFLSDHRQERRTNLGPICCHVDETGGQLKVDQMARMASYSMPQLRRLFLREVGVSPKKFAQIVRVRKARGHLDHNLGRNLTDTAFALGYYDQAHFVREFKSLTGLTPKQYGI